jgi:hypothetical protein
MSARGRLQWKLVWMALLVALIVLLGEVRHDFVYRAF